MSRAQEIMAALFLGSVFTIMAGFAAGVLAAKWWGQVVEPDRFWAVLGGSSLVIAAIWFSLLFRDVRSMDWR